MPVALTKLKLQDVCLKAVSPWGPGSDDQLLRDYVLLEEEI